MCHRERTQIQSSHSNISSVERQQAGIWSQFQHKRGGRRLCHGNVQCAGDAHRNSESVVLGFVCIRSNGFKMQMFPDATQPQQVSQGPSYIIQQQQHLQQQQQLFQQKQQLHQQIQQHSHYHQPIPNQQQQFQSVPPQLMNGSNAPDQRSAHL